MDFGQWATRRGLDVIQLHPPVLPEIQELGLEDDVASQTLNYHRPVLERPQVLAMVEGAMVRDIDGLVQLPSGEICYEGNWWIEYLKNNPSYKRCFGFRRRFLKGDYFSLLSRWSSAYFHWLQDVLPRLHTALPHLPAGVKFLINENLKEYQIKTLAAYGITESNLVAQPTSMDSRIQRLWFATPLGHSGITSPSILREVGRKIVDFYKDDILDSEPKNLWVSREKAASRRIVNEKDLDAIFKQLRIERVFPECLDFLGQLRLFGYAQSIFGPHGAGLANAMFCQMRAKIGEVYAGELPPCYLISCSGMGHSFSRFQAKSIPQMNGFDFHVDLQTMEKWLAENIKNA